MPDSIIPSIIGAFGDAMNFGIQGSQSQYLKDMQAESWRREDNAVQRRMADLKAAGINPLLAAGSAAATSSPIQVGVPQVDLHNAQGMSAMMRQAYENRLTQAQKDLSDQQYWLFANKGNAEIATAKSNAKAAAENAESARIAKETAQYNLGKWQEWHLPTNAPSQLAVPAGIPDTAKGLFPKAGNVITGAWGGIMGAMDKAVENALEKSRLEGRKDYESKVRKGEVTLQGGM